MPPRDIFAQRQLEAHRPHFGVPEPQGEAGGFHSGMGAEVDPDNPHPEGASGVQHPKHGAPCTPGATGTGSALQCRRRDSSHQHALGRCRHPRLPDRFTCPPDAGMRPRRLRGRSPAALTPGSWGRGCTGSSPCRCGVPRQLPAPSGGNQPFLPPRSHRALSKSVPKAGAALAAGCESVREEVPPPSAGLHKHPELFHRAPKHQPPSSCKAFRYYGDSL